MRGLLVAAVLLASGCSERRICYEGDLIACTCDDGRDGFATCDAPNNTYGACGFCGEVPGASWTATAEGGSGGAGGAGGAGGGGLLGFMETCAKNEECETGLCHTVNAKGPKCSLPCTVDNDCPPPSPGCNNQGVCKAP